MLNDYERKVLRILYNYNGVRKRFPTIHELTVKTGRDKTKWTSWRLWRVLLKRIT